MLRGAAVGGDDDEAVPVGQVEQRIRPNLAAPAALVGEQQHRCLADVAADPPAAEPEDAHVEGDAGLEEALSQGHAPILPGAG